MVKWLVILCVLSCHMTCSIAKNIKDTAVEFDTETIIRNMEDWDVDMAIMFYAPWCEYCKKLRPSWDEMANLMRSSKSVQVGVLNCENPLKNSDFCTEIGVDRYPSIYFVGYGKFYYPNAKHPAVVRYDADIIPSALYDWIRVLSTTSLLHRVWSRVKFLFSFGRFDGSSSSALSRQTVVSKVRTLEHRVSALSAELERYKALEVFDGMPDRGDVFPLLASLTPDEYNAPLRHCVAEYATEYCKYEANDDFCDSIADCSRRLMVPESCRPSVCPFKKRGCVVASGCLDKSTIEKYKQLGSLPDS